MATPPTPAPSALDPTELVATTESRFAHRSRGVWTALPWVLALAYLSALALLGVSFHGIERWKLKGLTEIGAPGIAGGNSSPTLSRLLRMAPEGLTSVRLSTRIDDTASAAAAPDDTLVLLVPRSSSDLSVTVNGSVVRSSNATTRERNDYRPLLIDIPPDRLHDGSDNQLELMLVGYNGVMVLSQLYLGPRSQLEPVFQHFVLFRQEFPRIALGITLLLGSAMLIMWAQRRRLAEYGWLGLAFLAFSYYLDSLISYREPASYALWTWSFLLARAVFIVGFVAFTHRFLQLSRRRLELVVVVLFAAVFAAGLYPALSGDYAGLMRLTLFSSLPLVLLLIVYLAVLFLQQLKRTGHVYLHWLSVGAVMGVLLGIYDVLVLSDLQHPLVVDFYVSHYAIIFSCVGAGAVVLHQLARALLDSRDLNEVLNRELALRSEELEREAEARLNQEKRLALARERERIMADMHDGVGGQLVSLLAANRSGRLSADTMDVELTSIFADLRLVLDVLSPAGDDLILALARLRERLEKLLAPTGIALTWSVDASLDAIPLPPASTVSVLRLVQECVQNAVKHGNPAHLTLSLTAEGSDVMLRIEDDGQGFDLDVVEPGRGLRNLKRRADLLGGNLELVSQPGQGTRVTLSLTPARLRSDPG
ncbi:MAG: ATP-binding protein [Pseudomonadota bacterium]